jgi:hypothetical protein
MAEKIHPAHAPNPPGLLLRLLLALTIGALYGFVLGKIYERGLPVSMLGLIFLTPLCMGIAAPFFVHRRSTFVLSRGLLLGLLAWFGITFTLTIWDNQQETAYRASCQAPGAPSECLRGVGWLTAGVSFYLGASFMLILLGAFIVGLVLKFVRKHASRKLAEESRRGE